MRVKLPPYVQAFVDRLGRPKYYVRRAGVPRVALPGLPYSPAFMAAYEAALGTAIEPGAGRAPARSFAALASSYYQSARFAELSPTSKVKYRRLIDRLLRSIGNMQVSAVDRSMMLEFIENRKATPATTNLFRAVLRNLFQRAIELGWIEVDPTQGTKPLRLKNPDGLHCWSEDEVSQFKSYWPVGSRERLALALLLNTGQRRSDAIRLGRQHIKRDAEGREWIHMGKQQKTGTVLVLPVVPELAEAIAVMPADRLMFLSTADGSKAYTQGSFGAFFAAACRTRRATVDLPRPRASQVLRGTLGGGGLHGT